jgi:hypothetical protein
MVEGSGRSATIQASLDPSKVAKLMVKDELRCAWGESYYTYVIVAIIDDGSHLTLVSRLQLEVAHCLVEALGSFWSVEACMGISA